MTVSPLFLGAAARWREVDREFAIVREAEYATAVEETGGFMINTRGHAAGWDSWRVFTGAPNVVRAYASEELRDHLARYPRTRRRGFEETLLREWLGDAT